MVMPGETLTTGAANPCPTCDVKLELQVCMSGAGYYIGSMCDCGPYSRESVYYAKGDEAQEHLDNGTWEPR